MNRLGPAVCSRRHHAYFTCWSRLRPAWLLVVAGTLTQLRCSITGTFAQPSTRGLLRLYDGKWTNSLKGTTSSWVVSEVPRVLRPTYGSSVENTRWTHWDSSRRWTFASSAETWGTSREDSLATASGGTFGWCLDGTPLGRRGFGCRWDGRARNIWSCAGGKIRGIEATHDTGCFKLLTTFLSNIHGFILFASRGGLERNSNCSRHHFTSTANIASWCGKSFGNPGERFARLRLFFSYGRIPLLHGMHQPKRSQLAHLLHVIRRRHGLGSDGNVWVWMNGLPNSKIFKNGIPHCRRIYVISSCFQERIRSGLPGDGFHGKKVKF